MIFSNLLIITMIGGLLLQIMVQGFSNNSIQLGGNRDSTVGNSSTASSPTQENSPEQKPNPSEVSQTIEPIRAAPEPPQKEYFSYVEKSKGLPTTWLKTPNGDKPFIRWDSIYFSPSGYTPEVRAKQVTKRLNEYLEKDPELKITHGRMNNLDILCVADDQGTCRDLLYTLKPDQDGKTAVDLIVQQLDKLKNPQVSRDIPPLREAECKTYISVKAAIEGEKEIAKKLCSNG